MPNYNFGMGFQSNPMDAYNETSGMVKQSRLAKLLGGYYQSGQADLGQIAQLDPQAAQAIQKEQQQRGLSKMFADVYGMPEDQRKGGIQRLLASGADFGDVSKLDPSMAGASGVQSTFVNDQGKRVAIMRDGSVRELGGNDMGMSQQTITVEGPNGEPVQMTFDKRTGNYRPLSAGPTTAQGVKIQYDGPPEDRAAFEQLVAADAQQPFAPGQFSAELPPQNVAPAQRQWTQNTPNPYGNAMPGVGMTAAEKAYAQEAAKQRAQIGALPEVGRIEAANAGGKEAAVLEARTQAERAAGAPKRAARYQQALSTAANVRTSIDKALGLTGKLSTGFMGARMRGIEGSPAYNLASEIETIKANLGFDRLQEMRDNSPTGGALGQVAIQELIALQSTVANLDPNQSEAQIKANLERIRGHYSRWEAAIRQAQGAEQSRGRGKPESAGGRKVVRTGTQNGRKVVQYSDGSVDYAD